LQKATLGRIQDTRYADGYSGKTLVRIGVRHQIRQECTPLLAQLAIRRLLGYTREAWVGETTKGTRNNGRSPATSNRRTHAHARAHKRRSRRLQVIPRTDATHNTHKTHTKHCLTPVPRLTGPPYWCRLPGESRRAERRRCPCEMQVVRAIARSLSGVCWLRVGLGYKANLDRGNLQDAQRQAHEENTNGRTAPNVLSKLVD
jgi:hypothetical protein